MNLSKGEIVLVGAVLEVKALARVLGRNVSSLPPITFSLTVGIF